MSAAPDSAGILGPFEPGIRAWFQDSFDAPTEVQGAAWPAIAADQHVLITAPTGSGKTLTAFLWALNRFAAGLSEPGATRVLYVSPLKALNNDIQRNLLTPLEALTARNAIPPIRALTRSGDTSRNERQRMLRRPPEILITTPESLNLMLTSSRGRHTLATVETVIVDEVHALADNRRGTLVLTALERLAHLSGEFQRIALSATVHPLEDIASFVAGRDESGTPRRMRIIDAPGAKAIEFSVRFPDAARHAADHGQRIWDALAGPFRDIVARNRATLFFTNSRALAEQITLAINRDLPAPLAYAHHGSLARDIRLEVETRLKQGELRAIVATSSLEMGIDIGALDEVVMIQSPPTIAATLQRLGRSGHRVGEVSRGVLFPTFSQDFLDAAALSRAVAERDLEPLIPLTGPLDVLAQIIVSMTASETWDVEGLYHLVCRSGPYLKLPRAQFDLVLEMLAGRYSGSRVRELKPRVSYDRIRQTVRAQHAAVLSLYSSGGVIPDRGYFHLRHAGSGAVIGELDEEFVWERRVGQVFTLGTQNWQIQRITHSDVLVKPTARAATAPPFWRAETISRSFHYASRVSMFLEHAESFLAAGNNSHLEAELVSERGFDDSAAEALVDYLRRQRTETRTPLPHHRHLVLERVASGPGGYRTAEPKAQLVVHNFWGGRVNRPWALALGAALARDGIRADIHADDNAVIIQTPEPLDRDTVLRAVTPDNLERLLRASLELSGLFGARFREAAGRSLLLTRQRFNARQPLWLSRLQAKKLMAAVADFQDFPALLEAWRTCLNDEFDLPALGRCLTGLEDGSSAVSECTTKSPSPFAAHLSFDQINPYMYADDTPEAGRGSALSDDLIRSTVRDAALRPRLQLATVEAFLGKRQRTAPGYQPEAGDDWAEWVKERILLPVAELEPLQGPFDHPDLVEVSRNDKRWLCHRELLQALFGSGLAAGARVDEPVPDVADPRDATELALAVLSFYGPLTSSQIEALLPTVPEGLLDDADNLVSGPLLADDDTLYHCDTDNFESLLRLQRAMQRPRLEPRGVRGLPTFLAAWQGFGETLSMDTLLEPLRGYRAPPAVWLRDLPGARQPDFEDHALDSAFAELGLHWQGAGNGMVRLGYPEDLDLLDESAGGDSEVAAWFADPAARYPFLQIADRQEQPLSRFNERWWQAVWRGEVAADTLTPLRQGIQREFRLGAAPAATRAASRGSRFPGRRRVPRTAVAEVWGGAWQLVPRREPDTDPLLALEDAKERARMLVDRYGLVCRELANREGGPLRWQALFRALRIMELGGEVVAGYFFDGLSGPQFAPPGALTLLQSPMSGPATFWCNAMDPVSPCGLGLDWPELPQRRPQNYLAFHDNHLALVVENLGKRLTVFLPVSHPSLDAVLAPLQVLLRRQRRLTLETINDLPARSSPYLPALEKLGRVVSDHRSSYLETATLHL